MRLSLQVRYAICGVFDLAYNGSGTLIRIQDISDRQAIPARYLEQIFQRLRRARIVTSKRGPGGGYSLAREAGEITIREILEAVEAPIERALLPEADEETSGFRPDFLWLDLAARISGALDAVTIDDVCRAATEAQVESAEGEGPMYFI